MAFNNRLRLQIITDTETLRVAMDLLAKTIITPPKIIFNNEYLPRKLKRRAFMDLLGVNIMRSDFGNGFRLHLAIHL